MRRFAFLICALAATGAAAQEPPALPARLAVDASAPSDIAVTIYRDEGRGGDPIDVRWVGGFAMISEVRQVTLPPGHSRIRFTGVAESMVAVSAIVTGLPGGTIEKNRNADLLSPAALVDGTLGNRVTITRTNPATGAEISESAVIRTRADGGLVLQTREGYEAVRCSGLPEGLTFDRVPEGLSSDPVFSVDTYSAAGGTHTVTLTYLATGFDWQANYVATFAEASREKDRTLELMAWLTVANGNGQSFPDAELMTVAGRINVTSDYEDLSDPPVARPLQLSCYPIGSTSRGTYPPPPAPPPPPPAPAPAMMADQIVVTGSRLRKAEMESAMAVTEVEAGEEALGDLKLYRVPVAVDVAAQSQKQVKFLTLDAVKGELMHTGRCVAEMEEALAGIELRSRNLETQGLGRSLPQGRIAVFEPSAHGPLLVAEDDMRDRAVGEDVEIVLSPDSAVIYACRPRGASSASDRDTALEAWRNAVAKGKWAAMEADVTNPTGEALRFELALGPASAIALRRASQKIAIYRGQQVLRIDVPAGATRRITWQMRDPNASESP
ncbi:DUF4139 domain-containing protein [Croceicoccus sp. Ery15]|uniref:DUF4139 domain-containing protein n=1 Tax=Croceicoccus sp. Ery15 TaxID=1703338 RepID=UPI001E3463FD|nr:hypothetical protein [Croceicoccus sp. Ery15]